jgi:hypothetical protein
VDWKYPANAGKSRDFRYLKKILTPVEIDFVHVAENPDLALGLFWACKETAYKVIGKSSARVPFLPRLWLVQLNQQDCSSGKGQVVLPGGNAVFIQFSCTERYVHCLGSPNLPDLNNIIWGIEPLPESVAGAAIEPSLFVRECLTRRVADIYSLNVRKMEIRRAKKGRELQPPLLYYENTIAPFDISLSHDGQFVAYSFIRL